VNHQTRALPEHPKIEVKIMREIKFRAWDTENKKIYYDVQNAHDGLGDIPIQSFGVLLDNTKEETRWPGDPLYVLMQYTGLKDRNGREIYEGDLVQIKELNSYFEYRDQLENLIVPVVYNPDAYCFQLNADDCGWGRLSLDLAELLVIGNIYENPELLAES